jgi:hypothetical protein
MRGMSQIMILCWRSPLQRKSCFAIAFRAKALRSGLPILAWQRHPFTNDCSARRVFGSHKQTLFWFISVEACAMQD